FPPLAARTYGFSVCQFGDPGINTRLTVPPGLSQSSTPFVASWRQDIPHMPLVAWPHGSHPPSRVVTRPAKESPVVLLGPIPLKTGPRVTILFSLRLMQRYAYLLRETRAAAEAADTPSRRWNATLTAAELSKSTGRSRCPDPGGR